MRKDEVLTGCQVEEEGDEAHQAIVVHEQACPGPETLAHPTVYALLDRSAHVSILVGEKYRGWTDVNK